MPNNKRNTSSPSYQNDNPPLTPFNNSLGTLPELMHHYTPDEMHIHEVEVGIPAFTPPTYIPHVKSMPPADLWDRIELALKLGRLALKRPLRSRSLSRREEQLFEKELSMFRDVLTFILQVGFRDGTVGYCISKPRLHKLMKKLKRRRDEAQDSLVLQCVRIPCLPVWGRNGDISEIWERNEFEILAACFRVEVEGFLGYLADFHEFDTASTTAVVSRQSARAEGNYERAREEPRNQTETETRFKYSLGHPLDYCDTPKMRELFGRSRFTREEPRKRTTRKVAVTEIEEEYYPA
ncbi:hypothetical protein BDQ17DRAFT_309206 [Cyathus striatus]|nr:hypothetical protein BDQ17DRAFT_309206 [Cyathus striatus]